ncbi:MAG: GNAT family N-acetyltransferase [Marinicaulis sp.]|nr:GNAT family N-acetyltransferase [Marinicaulis sp.]NNL90207.1 GNAT family N-acetyltransferase [Marinicaulis sp.]
MPDLTYDLAMSDAPPYRYAKQLSFRKVRPASDAKMLIAFGRALYRASTGGCEAFAREFGASGAGFIGSIENCVARNPDFAAFLDEDQHTVGFVALGVSPRDDELGRVHHFVVTSSHRGQGFGGLLDDYARGTLRAAGCSRAILNVTAHNERAIRFYEAQGWRLQSTQDGATEKPGGLRWYEVAL